MVRFACAGMRTKESRKLTLECHAGDNQGCFQQTWPGTGVRIAPTGPESGRRQVFRVQTLVCFEQNGWLVSAPALQDVPVSIMSLHVSVELERGQISPTDEVWAYHPKRVIFMLQPANALQ